MTEYDAGTIIDMLNDLELNEDDLTDWERNFVDSVQRRLSTTRPASEDQIEKVIEIWRRVVGG